MSVAVVYAHIEKLPDEPARLRQTPRVRVAQIVMDYLAHGWSVDEMCRHYPYLSKAEAHAAMAYYYDNQLEIDQEIADELEAVKVARAKAPPSQLVLRLRAQGLL